MAETPGTEKVEKKTEQPDFSTIEAIIAQDAPGKESPAAAQQLADQLASMSNEELLQLLEAAYQENAEANSLAIQKATELLEQRGAGKQAQAKVQEVRSESWRALLGDFIGGELYQLISDNVAPDDLQKYAHEALDGALGSLVGQVDKLGLEGNGTAALEKFAAALAEQGVKVGDKWLASEGGQKLLSKISGWVDDNPGLVLLGVILAAAGAVAADMPIPELKTKLKITEGLTADVAAKLGSLRNIALQAAKLDLQYVKGRFSAKATVEKTEKGTGGQVSVKYGSDQNFIQTQGSIDPEGKLVIDLNAAIQQGLFSGSLSAAQEMNSGNYSGKVSVNYGDKNNWLQANSQFKQEGDKLTANLNLGGQAQLGNDQSQLKLNGNVGVDQDKNVTQQFGADGRLKLNDNSFLHGNASFDGKNVSGQVGTTTQLGNLGLTQQLVSGKDLYSQNLLSYKTDNLNLNLDSRDYGANGSIDTVAAELGLTVPQLAAVIVKYGRDQQGVETGSVEVKHEGKNVKASGKVATDGKKTSADASVSYTKDNWLAELSAGVNLSTGDLEKVSAKLGFRDPNEFRAFSVELSHTVKDNSSVTELSAMFEAQLGAFMIRGTAGATLQNEGQNFSGSLLAARQLNPDWALIGGVSANRSTIPGQSSTLIPQVGVQYKNIPITVGWDFQNQGVVVGLTIPFGR